MYFYYKKQKRWFYKTNNKTKCIYKLLIVHKIRLNMLLVMYKNIYLTLLSQMIQETRTITKQIPVFHNKIIYIAPF